MVITAQAAAPRYPAPPQQLLSPAVHMSPGQQYQQQPQMPLPAYRLATPQSNAISASTASSILQIPGPPMMQMQYTTFNPYVPATVAAQQQQQHLNAAVGSVPLSLNPLLQPQHRYWNNGATNAAGGMVNGGVSGGIMHRSQAPAVVASSASGTTHAQLNTATATNMPPPLP